LKLLRNNLNVISVTSLRIRKLSAFKLNVFISVLGLLLNR